MEEINWNQLKDEEINNLFENENISEKDKERILIKYSERMKQLPTKIFIKVSSYASDVKAYQECFFKHIEKMSYEEFIDLIKNGIYEPEIIIELSKTEIYKRFLEKEKRERKSTNLQVVDLEIRLNNKEDLNKIGIEVFQLLQTFEKTEDLEELESMYLELVIKNIEENDLKSNSINSINICLAIMSLQMKRHEVLTAKMVEAYLKIRLKELNLTSICQNVIVTLGKEEKTFGYFVGKSDIYEGGTLKIYSEYIKKIFENLVTDYPREQINDCININYIQMLSHELEHCIKMKKYIPSKDSEVEWFEKINRNKGFNYYYRNQELHAKIGDKKYDDNHQIFIEEIQADLFAIFDANQQLLTKFKDVFPQNILENIVSGNAKEIIKFYKDAEGNIISPMEKFDIFYQENIGKSNVSIITDENPDIMSSLLNGDKIPMDIINFLEMIASRKVITQDLYQTLIDFIQNRNDSIFLEEKSETETQSPTL